MQAGPNYVIVKIDKAAQKLKRERIGNILLPPQYQYMQYNLQYGEVLHIGRNAKKEFPELEVGSTAILHHTVEEDDKIRLISVEPNGDELRLATVKGEAADYQVFGFLKNNIILPHPNFIFISPKKERVENKVVHELFKGVDTDIWKSDEALTSKIADIDRRVNDLKSSIRAIPQQDRKEECDREIQKLDKEKLRIAKYMNSAKFSKADIMYINPNTAKDYGISISKKLIVRDDLLYQLIIFGHNFFLARKDYVVAQLN